MIRKWNTNQFEPLLGLWLESTTYAHPFIAEQYWQESLPIVRDTYLPAAETWVFEEEQRLQGFVVNPPTAATVRWHALRTVAATLPAYVPGPHRPGSAHTA